MQTVPRGKSEAWSGKCFTIKIDDCAGKNEYRPVCSDKMRIIKYPAGIAQDFNKSVVAEQYNQSAQ